MVFLLCALEIRYIGGFEDSDLHQCQDSFLFNLTHATPHYLWRGNGNWRIALIRLAFGNVMEALSWLITAMGGSSPLWEVPSIPWEMAQVCIRKLAQHKPVREPPNRVPSWHLLDFLPWSPSMMDYDLELTWSWHEPFPPQRCLALVFVSGPESKLEQLLLLW